ncbi:MAG TPA: signal peptide peptidase SppA [Planctomycetota bacterium]|nr:signal peptide peptidase SppA [Planctomycetota bacterium]
MSLTAPRLAASFLLSLMFTLCITAADAAPASPDKPAAPAGDPAVAAAPAGPRVFHLVLRGEYVEHKNPQGFSPAMLFTGGRVKQKSFFDLIGFIDRGCSDVKLQGIFIDMQDPDFDLTPTELDVLLGRLDKFHVAGKKLFAYIEGGTKLQFLIACHCDTVVMPEMSNLEIGAPSMQIQFFSDTLASVGVKMQAIRAGAYKSAVEPFTRNSMSAEMRENYTTLLTDLDAQVLKLTLNGRRKLAEAAFRELRKDQILTVSRAKTAGLVDEIGGLEDMREIMHKSYGVPVELLEKPKTPPPQLNLMSLFSMDRTEPVTRWKGDGVAVLFLAGEIVDGRGESVGGSQIAEFPTVEAIQELAADDKAKAVVLRINSPGGSASASERINRALVALAAKKPLVVSMGDYAASGGYYIAAPAKTIFAQPTTLTGSIGVFGIIPDFGGLLEKIGVKTETISLDGTLPISGMQALTDRQKQMYEKDIDEAYHTFLARVAEGRHKTTEEIHKIAQGRVYSGSQGKEVGLVDEIGTLDDAVAAAAKLAGLPEGYDKQYFPKYPELRGLMDFLDALSPDATALPIGDAALARAFPLLAELRDQPAIRRLTQMLQLIRLQSRNGHQMAVFAWDPALPAIR